MLKRSKITKNEIKQKFNLKKLLGYTPNEQQKEMFYDLAVNKMVQRTASGKDIKNENFKPYTKDYASKKGVSRNSVDLILTGDMLNGFENEKTDKNSVEISIKQSETGKAHGNITGSYGKSSGSKAKARDFFGFRQESDLMDIITQIDSMREAESTPSTTSAVDLVALRQAVREVEVEFSDFGLRFNLDEDAEN